MCLIQKHGFEIVSEILYQIVFKICTKPPLKSKKRSADNTEMYKKRGDKKCWKNDAIKPSGKQLPAVFPDALIEDVEKAAIIAPHSTSVDLVIEEQAATEKRQICKFVNFIVDKE